MEFHSFIKNTPRQHEIAGSHLTDEETEDQRCTVNVVLASSWDPGKTRGTEPPPRGPATVREAGDAAGSQSRCPPIQMFSQTRCPPVQVSPHPGVPQTRCSLSPGVPQAWSPAVQMFSQSWRPDAQQPSLWGWSPVGRREARHPCRERSREEGAAWGQGPQRVHHPRTSTWSPGRVQAPLTVPWRCSVSGWAGTLRRPRRGTPPPPPPRPVGAPGARPHTRVHQSRLMITRCCN